MNVAGLTRAWTEWIANLSDRVPGGVPSMVLLSVVAGVVIGVLWYFFPAWLPWRWTWRLGAGRGRRRMTRRVGSWRFGRLRWRLRWRRRRGRRAEPEQAPLADDLVPDLPAEVLAMTADELAAAGRYAEAVRERLRSMLRLLIERGILPASPGWTVMELAGVARRARPALAGPMSGAADVFSTIWYGLRTATEQDDTAMRGYAAEVAKVADAPATSPMPTAAAGSRA
jgi:hypothetical protein